MNPSERVLQKLQAIAEENQSEVHYPKSAKDIKSVSKMKKEGNYVYIVSNGSNVLQVGKGTGHRVKKCMRGSIAGKHTKAYICALGELVLGQPNTYAYVPRLSSDCAESAEIELHELLGVRTNQDTATLIEGIDARSISEIHEDLWMRAKDTECYQSLDSVEKQMAEELFEVVTYATTKIKRSKKWVRSSDGDNLEGNILERIDKSYLIDVFIKLTNGYFRYGKHRLSSQAFEDFKQSYHYTHYGRPFDILG